MLIAVLLELPVVFVSPLVVVALSPVAVAVGVLMVPFTDIISCEVMEVIGPGTEVTTISDFEVADADVGVSRVNCEE